MSKGTNVYVHVYPHAMMYILYNIMDVKRVARCGYVHCVHTMLYMLRWQLEENIYYMYMYM